METKIFLILKNDDSWDGEKNIVIEAHKNLAKAKIIVEELNAKAGPYSYYRVLPVDLKY